MTPALHVHDGYLTRDPSVDGPKEGVTGGGRHRAGGATGGANPSLKASPDAGNRHATRGRGETSSQQARHRRGTWDEFRRSLERVVRRDYPTLTRLVTTSALREVVDNAVVDCLFAGHRLADRALIRSLRAAIEAGLVEALEQQVRRHPPSD